MKISTFITMFLIISAVFFIFTLMANDVKEYYPQDEQNISEWSGKYEFSDNVSDYVEDIQSPLEKLGDEDKGWVLRTISGVAAIPAALIALVTVVFKSFLLGGKVITGTFSSLNIPNYLIAIVISMISLWGIFKLVEIVQRWKV